jgi:hypothetical protein
MNFQTLALILAGERPSEKALPLRKDNTGRNYTQKELILDFEEDQFHC